MLRQSRRQYQSYQEQIQECDREIEKMVKAFVARVDPAEKPLPPDRKGNRNAPKKESKRQKQGLAEAGFDLRTEAYKLFGVDVTQIPGLEMSVLALCSEVGRDLASRWKTSAHFVSWAGLCPDNDISGGRVLWKGSRKLQNRAGQIFRMAAYSRHRSQTPLGAFLRRKKYDIGRKAATTATAHKIAVIFYTLVAKQVEYDESIWATRDAQREERMKARVKRDARKLGYALVPIAEKPAA